jgi:hypothetical protein
MVAGLRMRHRVRRAAGPETQEGARGPGRLAGRRRKAQIGRCLCKGAGQALPWFPFCGRRPGGARAACGQGGGRVTVRAGGQPGRAAAPPAAAGRRL